jgi:hypothetical protein
LRGAKLGRLRLLEGGLGQLVRRRVHDGRCWRDGVGDWRFDWDGGEGGGFGECRGTGLGKGRGFLLADERAASMFWGKCTLACLDFACYALPR